MAVFVPSQGKKDSVLRQVPARSQGVLHAVFSGESMASQEIQKNGKHDADNDHGSYGNKQPAPLGLYPDISGQLAKPVKQTGCVNQDQAGCDQEQSEKNHCFAHGYLL